MYVYSVVLENMFNGIWTKEVLWFKSYNDVPDELKARIEASTIMLKTHSNCAGMLPEEEPNKIWLNIDSASYRQSYNHYAATTFMVNL